MSKQSKSKSIIFTILKILLVVLLLLGVVGLIIHFVSTDEEDDITGMYVKYGDNNITAENDGISVSYSDTETAVFTICNSEDWGIYSVTGCTVKVINNVTSASSYDFEYIESGANLPSTFSDITDFTSVFSTNGNTVTVNEDGTFELAFKYSSMAEILQAYTGKTVSIDGSVAIYSYSYFSIQVTSPDEETVITIPFVYLPTITISSNNIAF